MHRISVAIIVSTTIALLPRLLPAQTPHAPAAAAAVALDRLLSSMQAEVHPGSDLARGERTTPERLVGVVRGGYGEPLWILQQDSSMRQPFAAPGDSLILVDPTTRRTSRTRVSARRLVIGTGDEACGGPALDSALRGWAFAAYPLPDVDEPVTMFAFPGAATFGGDAAVPDGIRRALHDSMHVAATGRLADVRRTSGEDWASEIRRSLFAEDGSLSPNNALTILPVRVNGALQYAASVRLSDDPSDHGLETRWTLVVDSAGRRIARLDGVNVTLAVDADVDGTDELLTDNALTYYDGTSWIRAIGWTGPGSC